MEKNCSYNNSQFTIIYCIKNITICPTITDNFTSSSYQVDPCLVFSLAGARKEKQKSTPLVDRSHSSFSLPSSVNCSTSPQTTSPPLSSQLRHGSGRPQVHHHSLAARLQALQEGHQDHADAPDAPVSLLLKLPLKLCEVCPLTPGASCRVEIRYQAVLIRARFDETRKEKGEPIPMCQTLRRP